MNNVLRPCQQRNVAQNDNAVETVVYKSQHAAKQRCEGVHRSSPVVLLQQQDHRTDGWWKSKYRRAPERDERVQGNETCGFVPLEFGHFKQRRRESSACNGWCCRERQREKAVRATVAVRVSPDLGKKAGRSGDAISASLDTRWCASAHRLPNRPAIGRCRQPRPRLAAALR